MTTRVILFHTEGCHLCELALMRIQPLVDRGDLTIECRDIIDDPEALVAYAEKIPVLTDMNQQDELCWPFDEAAVVAFLQGDQQP